MKYTFLHLIIGWEPLTICLNSKTDKTEMNLASICCGTHFICPQFAVKTVSIGAPMGVRVHRPLNYMATPYVMRKDKLGYNVQIIL